MGVMPAQEQSARDQDRLILLCVPEPQEHQFSYYTNSGTVKHVVYYPSARSIQVKTVTMEGTYDASVFTLPALTP